MDLLLALISKNKINIYDIPIAELLEQYLEQIALMREANLDVASEFLEMAARLVYIKSVSLLPRQEEEEDPRLELTGLLLEYQQCKQAAGALGSRLSFNRVVRSPMEFAADLLYRREHEPKELLSALLSAWGKGRSLLPPKPESFSELVTKKIVSVTSQVIYVLRRLWQRKKMPYHRLFSGKTDRSERVAVFLAVLELVKNRRIRVEGEGEAIQVILVKDRREQG